MSYAEEWLNSYNIPKSQHFKPFTPKSTDQILPLLANVFCMTHLINSQKVEAEKLAFTALEAILRHPNCPKTCVVTTCKRTRLDSKALGQFGVPLNTKERYISFLVTRRRPTDTVDFFDFIAFIVSKKLHILSEPPLYAKDDPRPKTLFRDIFAAIVRELQALHIVLPENAEPDAKPLRAALLSAQAAIDAAVDTDRERARAAHRKTYYKNKKKE